MRKFLFVMIAIFAVGFGAKYLLENMITLSPVIKVAKEKDKLDNVNVRYIICMIARTTGYSWRVIQNEDGDVVDDYCNIAGPNPLDMGISYDIRNAYNTYIFYIKEKNSYDSAELGEIKTEYVVVDWDILYPIQHEFPFFRSRRYIVQSDVIA